MTPDEFNARVLVFALTTVMISVVIVLLIGLFDVRVDNKEVFQIIGPTFQMIVGWAVGRLGKR